ncbi:MAG: hypothetical protein ACE5IR_10085 [bacterium]
MQKLCFFSCLGLFLLNYTSSLFGLSLADSLRVQALNNQVNAATLYALDFTLADTLFSESIIEVVFPTGFDLSRVTLAGSKTINGGFDVDVREQTVYLKRKGRGRMNIPGEKVDVKLAIVKNPPTVQSKRYVQLKINQKGKRFSSKGLLGSLLISRKKSVIEK